MATKFITGEVNKLAHQLRKVYPSLTWGQAFRFAIKGVPAQRSMYMEPTSIFGAWTLPSQRSLAGHFWALAKSYEQLNDPGRAYSFKNVAGLLYSLCDEGITLTFGQAISRKGWGESIISEMIECFVSGLDSVDTTKRMMHLHTLIPSLHSRYVNPRWTF